MVRYAFVKNFFVSRFLQQYLLQKHTFKIQSQLYDNAYIYIGKREMEVIFFHT
jgi:hypothetical protein